MTRPSARPQEAGQRTLLAHGVFALLRRYPVSITLTLAVVVIGILTGTVFRSDHQAILDAVGFDLQALKSGRVWPMPAATLIQADTGLKWHLALLVLAVGPLEYLAGSIRALVTFFLTDWVSAIITTLMFWGFAALGSDTADRLVHTPDMGSSSAAVGVIAAAAAVFGGRLGAVVLVGLFVVLGAAYAFEGLEVETAHVVAAVAGTVLGRFLWRRQRAHRLLDLPPGQT